MNTVHLASRILVVYAHNLYAAGIVSTLTLERDGSITMRTPTPVKLRQFLGLRRPDDTLDGVRVTIVRDLRNR